MNKIRHLNILPPTLLLAISALLSRLLGVIRDHLLARSFGAMAGAGIYNLDAYYAAFRIPDLLYSLLIFGAISASFIPIFTQHKKENDMDNAWAFASSMLHLMFLFVLAISAVIYLFAPYLVHFVAGGFDAEGIALTVKLMRILLLSPIIMSLSAVLISIQDSFKTFFWRSLGPLFYNLGIIASILYFAEAYGVVGVAWGVILGAALQLIFQLPALAQVRYKHKWIIGTKRKDVRQAFRLLVPRVLGLSMTQITLIVNTLIASFLVTGSITVFYLADNLQGLPLGIIGISFAITSFATLSELAGEKTPTAFAKEIRRVTMQILFFIVPATLGMMLLRNEIIDLILRAGKFTVDDAQLTSYTLGFLLISLFAQSLIPLIGRGFYAYHDTKTPLLTGVTGGVISVLASLLLAIKLGMGIAGIAISFSLGAIVNFLLLYLLMAKRVRADLIDWNSLFKMVLSTIVMGVFVFIAKELLPYGGTALIKIGLLSVYTVIGAFVYFMFAKLLLVPEVEVIWRHLRKMK